MDIRDIGREDQMMETQYSGHRLRQQASTTFGAIGPKEMRKDGGQARKGTSLWAQVKYKQ